MIIRLNPDVEGHWDLYETFERRCVDYGERCGWPINEVLKRDMRSRWVQAPSFSGYFISEDGRAHLLSWFLTVWGEAGIQVYQAEGEAGALQPLLQEFFEVRLPQWYDQLEGAMGHRHSISFIELATERPDEWERLLRRYRNVTSRRPMTLMRLAAYQEN